MRSWLSLSITLLLLLSADIVLPADLPRMGRHDVWQTALESGARALDEGHVVIARSEADRALREAVHFPTGDDRVAKTLELIKRLARARAKSAGVKHSLDDLVEMRGIAESLGGPDHPLTLRLLLEIAQTLTRAFKHDAAEATYEAIHERAVRALGPGHPISLASQTALSRVLLSQKKIEEAEDVARGALAASRAAFGRKSSTTVRAGLALVVVLNEQGLFEEAEALCEEIELSFESAAERLDPVYGEVAETRSQIALNRYKYEDAIQYGEAAIRVFEVTGGRIGSSVYGTIAKAAHRLGDLARADTWSRVELEMIQGAFGTNSARAVSALIRLSEIEADRGNYALAERYLRRTIDMTGGLDHYRMPGRGLLARLGEVVGAQGRREEAESLLDIDLQAVRQKADSHGIGTVLTRFASHYQKTGQWKQAQRASEEAMELLDRPDHFRGPVFIRGLHVRAQVQAHRGKRKQALRSFERAVVEAGEVLGEESPTLVPILDDYAEVLHDARRRKEEKSVRARSERIAATRDRRASEAAANPAGHVFEARNLRVAELGPSWVPLEPAALQVTAQLAFFNRRDRVWATIEANPRAPGSLERLSDLVAALKSNIEGSRDDVRWLVDRELEVGGLAGRELIADTVDQGNAFRYRIWVSSYNGFTYQISAWTTELTDDFPSRSEPLFRAFSPIDLERVAAGWEALREYASAQYGYRVDLETNQLVSVPDLRPELADMSAVAADGQVGVLVVPFSLLGTEPSAQVIEDVLVALLAVEGDPTRERVEYGGLKGVEVVTDREVANKPFRYRGRVLYGQGRAFGVVVWHALESNLPPPSLDILTLEAAVSPLAIEDLSPRDRERHAILFISLGEWESDRSRPTAAATYYAKAVALLPDNANVLGNLIGLMNEAGRYQEAEQRAQEAHALFPENGWFSAQRAFALHSLGRLSAAIASYEEALALGYQTFEVLEIYSSALIDAGRVDEALDVIDQRIAQADSVQLQRLRAGLLESAGRLDEAVEALEEIAESRPGDVELLFGLADGYSKLKQGQRALAVCDQLEAIAPGTARLHATRATAFYSLARYEEALVSIRSATELDPGFPGSADFTKFLTTLTGEGDNALVRREIEPLVVPDWAPPPPQPSSTFGEEHGAYYVRRATVLRVGEGIPRRKTELLKIRILDSRGVARYGTLQFGFESEGERLFVNELLVRDAEGAVVGRNTPTDIYVLDESGSEIATARKIAHVPVRGLRPGTTIEALVTWEDLFESEKVAFESITLARGIPMLRAEFYLLGDIARVEHATQGPLEHTTREVGLGWWVDDPPVVAPEPWQAHPESHLPMVRLSDLESQWKSLGTGYLVDIDAPLSEREAAGELARELAGEERDPTELVRRFTSFLQEEVRYEAVEFGIHARVPRNAQTVIASRYGDCKDHALLLHLLLDTFEIESQLALVRSAGPLSKELPDLSQFDHMIVYCKSCGPSGRFIDTTDKASSPIAAVPRGLGGAVALILDPEASRLAEIPPAEQERIAVSRTIELQADGSARISEEVKFEGDLSASIRSALNSLDRSLWESTFFYPMLSRGVDVEFEKIEARHLLPSEQGVELSLRYEVKRVLAETAGGLAGVLPAIWEETLLGVSRVANRRTPFTLKVPLVVDVRVDVVAPASHRFSGLDTPKEIRGARRFHEWNGKRRFEPGRVVLEAQVRRASGEHPADSYEEFVAEASAALNELRPGLALELRSAADEP